MDIRYYADTDPQTRQPDGLFRVMLDTKASWVENLTHSGWVHDDDRAGDVEEYGVRPVSEQQAQMIAQHVFGVAQLDPPTNPWEHPDTTEGGEQDGGQPNPADAPAAGKAGGDGSPDGP